MFSLCRLLHLLGHMTRKNPTKKIEKGPSTDLDVSDYGDSTSAITILKTNLLRATLFSCVKKKMIDYLCRYIMCIIIYINIYYYTFHITIHLGRRRRGGGRRTGRAIRTIIATTRTRTKKKIKISNKRGKKEEKRRAL